MLLNYLDLSTVNLLTYFYSNQSFHRAIFHYKMKKLKVFTS